MYLNVLIFDLISVEGNDTFQSEIEAHGGPRSALIRLDLPCVDFPWGSMPLCCVHHVKIWEWSPLLNASVFAFITWSRLSNRSLKKLLVGIITHFVTGSPWFIYRMFLPGRVPLNPIASHQERSDCRHKSSLQFLAFTFHNALKHYLVVPSTNKLHFLVIPFDIFYMHTMESVLCLCLKVPDWKSP
jgi:hypothetical protein